MVLSAGESRFFDGVLFLLHLRKQPDLCEMECHSNVTKFQGQFLQFCFDACLNGCFFSAGVEFTFHGGGGVLKDL